jgi:predicted enzyme involved in methoxymalonyl-ACP biosynthesis
MSCRVLGRGVETATLNLVAAQASGLGAARLIGHYLPTAKNGMVREHYTKLGFTPVSQAADGESLAVLELADFAPRPVFIHVAEGSRS